MDNLQPTVVDDATFNEVNDAVEQFRGSHTALSNSAGAGEPVGEGVVEADTALCVCVQSF